MRRALAAALLLSPLGAGADDDEMGRRLQEALRRRGQGVHRCFAASLDRDPRAEGELLIQIELGEAGRVRRAEVLKDQSSAPGLGDCLTATISAWTLPELRAAPGDRVVFPLVFRRDLAPPPPIVIGERGARRPPGRSPGTTGPARLLYVSPATHPATQGQLSLVTARPGTAPLAEAGATTVAYVLSGTGQLLGPGGRRQDLGAGDGVLVPRGAPFALTGALRWVEVSEVPAAGAGRPPGPGAPPLLVRGGAAAPLAILGGRGRVRILVDQGAAEAAGHPGVPGVSLERLECDGGVEVPVHQHEGSDELLYIVSGRGVMSAGEERDIPVGAGDAVRVPRGVPHGLRVLERLVAVQSYAPAGPEGRFRPPPAPAAKDVLEKKK